MQQRSSEATFKPPRCPGVRTSPPDTSTPARRAAGSLQAAERLAPDGDALGFGGGGGGGGGGGARALGASPLVALARGAGAPLDEGMGGVLLGEGVGITPPSTTPCAFRAPVILPMGHCA